MIWLVDPSVHMWFGMGLTVLAFYFFASEKWPLEVTSVVLLAIILLFGQLFPLPDELGKNLLGAQDLLAGFANPSLIAVLALLVIGQAMVQTAALTPVTRLFLRLKHKWAMLGLVFIFLFVLVVSAIMNNTPLVIIAIPVMQALAARVNISVSRIMIPLSYVAILGGMTTLVGSSTNMLVSTALTDLGYEPFSFFEFTVPGAMLAAVGAFYVLIILPYMMPNRHTMAQDLQGDGSEKLFIAEMRVSPGSKLIGRQCEDDKLPDWPDVELRLVHRTSSIVVPPFDEVTIESGDVLIVAATRETLMDMLAMQPGYLLSESEAAMVTRQPTVSEALQVQSDIDDGLAEDDEEEAEQVVEIPQDEEDACSHALAEVMIKPASRLIDKSIGEAEFEENFNCTVLGIQRHARVIRRRLHQMRLQSGDVLLVAADHESIRRIRQNNTDVIVLSGTRRDIPVGSKAPAAGVIFMVTIGSAAFGFLPIPVAAVVGAVAMLLAGCLNVRQMMRAFDRKIFFLVGAALALGTMLQVSDGATFIAGALLELPIAQDPFLAACLLFIVVAIGTNLLSNNACAVLFTPIAINLATELGQDPFVFAMTVVFAANCSFASPIGYQTNLLVMGPGHYQFRDFMKAGIPLVLIVWAAYAAVAKFYFGL